MFRESLPNLSSKVRFINAVPGTPNIDIYTGGNLLKSNLAFGTISEYIDFAPGDYVIDIYPSGTYDTAIFSGTLTIIPNSYSTASLITNNSELSFFVLRDTASKASLDISFLRFINLSPTSPLLSLSIRNRETLFDSVEYLETTGYYPLSPGIYNFTLSLSGATSISRTLSNVSLIPGEFETLYVVGVLNGEPEVGYILTRDGRQA
ncbi:MAG: DUF4397 domain-containing protein [Clostridium baratii]|uniref:DUF4397 domain-containing protein n=1 Tax=Clostridium baratii TaxID=1561 RepID=UPI00242A475D|nr:DUF4397 domain-containing protein [Clostridium baratii]MBS6042526.1 DUF4397 domain-containing protein [Clostridium baratii]